MFEKLNKNDRHIDLLYNKPHEFINENQSTISIILNRYIKLGYIKREDKAEAIQFINYRLLDGILEKIKQNYDKTYHLSTYFSAVVNNLCKEFLNNNLKENRTIPLEQITDKEKIFTSEKAQILIDEEIDRLEIILRLFHNKRNKVIVALKIKYRIPIIDDEFKWFLNISDSFTEEISARIKKLLIDSKNEVEMFNKFSEIYNELNEKQITGESLRHWSYLKINEIIELLNDNGKESLYNLETFGVLFEKYSRKLSFQERNFIYIDMDNSTNEEQNATLK